MASDAATIVREPALRGPLWALDRRPSRLEGPLGSQGIERTKGFDSRRIDYGRTFYSNLSLYLQSRFHSNISVFSAASSGLQKSVNKDVPEKLLPMPPRAQKSLMMDSVDQ